MADNEKWYIYHKYDGKVVLDRTDNSDHMRQHYASDPKFSDRNFLAGTRQPLTPPELKALEERAGAPFDPSPRPALRPYTPQERATRKPYSSKPVGAQGK